jgi:hypothetical protein
MRQRLTSPSHPLGITTSCAASPAGGASPHATTAVSPWPGTSPGVPMNRQVFDRVLVAPRCMIYPIRSIGDNRPRKTVEVCASRSRKIEAYCRPPVTACSGNCDPRCRGRQVGQAPFPHGQHTRDAVRPCRRLTTLRRRNSMLVLRAGHSVLRLRPSRPAEEPGQTSSCNRHTDRVPYSTDAPNPCPPPARPALPQPSAALAVACSQPRMRRRPGLPRPPPVRQPHDNSIQGSRPGNPIHLRASTRTPWRTPTRYKPGPYPLQRQHPFDHESQQYP